jgi:hypothetical protein
VQVDPREGLDLEEAVERLGRGPGRAGRDRLDGELTVDVQPQDARVRQRLLDRPAHASSIA